MGMFAVQLAKNVFGAENVVTTLSTGKIPKIGGLIGEGVVGQMVDYTKEDVVKTIGKRKVDFMFDLMGQTLSASPVVKDGGYIVSVSTIPSGKMVEEHDLKLPYLVARLLDLVDWFFRFWVGRKGVGYQHMGMRSNSTDLEKMAAWIDTGKLKVVVGKTAKLSDIDTLREGCQQVSDGKGGIGKFAIEFD